MTPCSLATLLGADAKPAGMLFGESRLGIDVRREDEVLVSGEARRRDRVAAERRPQHARLPEHDVEEAAAGSLAARIAPIARP